MPRAGRIFCGRSSPADRPARLLIIVAFGLLTGQRPPPLDLKPLFIFFAPILAFALTLTATGVIRGVYQPILTGIALCAAIPVALEKPVSPLIYSVLTTAVALAIGFDSAPEPSSTGVLIKALAGTGIMVILPRLRPRLLHQTRHGQALAESGRAGYWFLDHRHLVSGPCPFPFAFITHRNGLAKALISAADANVRTLGEHRPRSVFNQRVEID